MSYGTRVVLTRSGLVISLLLLLQFGPALGLVDRLTLLPLSEIAAGVFDLARGGDFWQHLWASTYSIVSAFAIATVGGVALGYLLWRHPVAYKALNPYLVSYYATPVFAFYPILIVLFGANRIPIVLIAVGWAIVAVIMPTVEGLHRVSNAWEKVGEVYHLSPWQMFWQIRLPAALPYVGSGVKLAVTYSILGVVASEFILSSEGLGYLVSSTFNNFRLEQMWGSIAAVLLVAVALNRLANFMTTSGRFFR